MANREIKNKEENIHLYLAFLRKKFNKSKSPRTIREIIKNEDSLSIIKKRCELAGGYWRIHKTVNSRSTVKAMKTLQIFMINNPDCHTYIDSLWKTCLLQEQNKAERNFMLDIDSKDPQLLQELAYRLNLCQINDYTLHKTPGGFHLICRPFDVRNIEGLGNITVLKDGYCYVDEVGEKDL